MEWVGTLVALVAQKFGVWLTTSFVEHWILRRRLGGGCAAGTNRVRRTEPRPIVGRIATEVLEWEHYLDIVSDGGACLSQPCPLPAVPPPESTFEQYHMLYTGVVPAVTLPSPLHDTPPLHDTSPETSTIPLVGYFSERCLRCRRPYGDDVAFVVAKCGHNTLCVECNAVDSRCAICRCRRE